MGGVMNKSPLHQTLAPYTTYDGSSVNQAAIFHDVFFVKWVHESMMHNGFHYQKGVNHLKTPFVPYGEGEHGGLYFVDNKNASGYAKPYPQYRLWRVRLPDTARVYTGNNVKQFKTNMLIFDEMIHIKNEAILKPIYKDCAARGKLQGYDDNNQKKKLNIIPPYYRTQDVMEYALDNNSPDSPFSSVDPGVEFLSWGPPDDVLYKAVKTGSLFLRHLPFDRCTYHLCYHGLQSGNVGVYELMPEMYKTLEMTDLALSITGAALEYTPLAHRDYDRCKTAVSNFGQSLKDVPWNHRRKRELVLLALLDEGYLIDETQNGDADNILIDETQHASGDNIMAKQQKDTYVVPDVFRQDMDCQLAASWTYFHVWDRIPSVYHTRERALYAIQSERSDVCFWKTLPSSWQSHELLTALVQHEPDCASRLIPTELIDTSLADLMFAQGYGLSIPPRHLTIKRAWEIAKDGVSAHCVPSVWWTDEMVYHAVVSYHKALEDIQEPSKVLSYPLLLNCVIMRPKAIAHLPSAYELPLIKSWFPQLLHQAGMVLGHAHIQGYVRRALQEESYTVGRYLPPPSVLDEIQNNNNNNNNNNNRGEAQEKNEEEKDA